MFNKLKDKLKNWAKKVSEQAEETEEVIEEPTTIFPPTKKTLDKSLTTKDKKIKFEPNLEELKEKAKKLEEKESKNKITNEQQQETHEPGTKSFFKKISEKTRKIKISEKEFGVYSEELEMLLLENNVALKVSEKIIQDLKEQIVGKELLKKELEWEIKDLFKKIIKEILIEPFDLVKKIKEKISDQSKEPYVILFCGINGTGKTTTLAKIADFLKNNGISCVLAAADTFRAASIEQIKKHGDNIGIKVISQDYGSDPAAVGFDAIKYAKKNLIACVLIDTAGRMHTSKNLLKEIEKISRVCKPDTKIFVGESITGNDAIEQAKSFDWAIGIDGIILTKADIDEKGGTALSVGYITKKPILYLGTGQEYDKIVVFSKEKFIERLGL